MPAYKGAEIQDAGHLGPPRVCSDAGWSARTCDTSFHCTAPPACTTATLRISRISIRQGWICCGFACKLAFACSRVIRRADLVLALLPLWIVRSTCISDTLRPQRSRSRATATCTAQAEPLGMGHLYSTVLRMLLQDPSSRIAAVPLHLYSCETWEHKWASPRFRASEIPCHAC